MRFWYGLLGLLIISGAAAQSTSPEAEEAFNEVEVVEDGLGPRFNLDSCGGCHSHPSVGGSSPASNPQVAMATAFGAQNVVPSFITKNGPIREVRFKSDSKVHALFVITGRSDIPSGANPPCTIKQEDFEQELQKDNVIFRIPTPLFGAGMVEGIPDAAIRDNLRANADLAAKQKLRIGGKLPSIVSGNLGRFGWKAQHSNLVDFAGEAYNVEMGITNEVSKKEIEQNEDCQYAEIPNSPEERGVTSDVQLFAEFMRALPPPNSKAKDDSGRLIFENIGCNLCHTPELAGVQLFSDLLLHDMGDGLADGITQNSAGPREFRSAPLWGVGRRLFLLHDGRTRDLDEAIRAHASNGSDANDVINNFLGLKPSDHGALLNFLRSL